METATRMAPEKKKPSTSSTGAVDPSKIQLPEDWKELLMSEFEKPYMAALKQFLKKEKAAGKVIYPPGAEIFNAFHQTAYRDVKVLLLGQDPYHGEGQAHGLAFSVRKGVKLPPSLRNIFKELNSDLGISAPQTGDLTGWAKQGVMLLNTCLTVERGQAGSHHGMGWEAFTDRVIQTLNDREEPIVFVFWGAPAQKKAHLVTNDWHRILKSPHPSPFSADRGFFGSRPFSKINEALLSWGQKPIDWKL